MPRVGERISVDPRPFAVLSLCSGIGGIELGLSLAVPSSRTVCYVEREAYAAAVLVERMAEGMLDEAPVWTDLRTFDGRPWRGKVDCLTAGYPCQPFSVAGPRLGERDHRYLWGSVRRVISEAAPPFVFLENVAHHLRDGFERVRDDLLRMGYRVTAGIFTAEEIGAPFEGRRLFALAEAVGSRIQGRLGRESPRLYGQWGWRGEEDLRLIANTPFERGNRWPQPLIRRMDARYSRRMERLGAIGNTVVPAMAAYALRILATQSAEEITMGGYHDPTRAVR